MVSAKKVCRSGHIVIYTLSAENIPTFIRFYLINLLKKKTCVKQSTAAKAIFSDTRILTV